MLAVMLVVMLAVLLAVGYSNIPIAKAFDNCLPNSSYVWKSSKLLFRTKIFNHY